MNTCSETKIRPTHLARSAVVYVRQSTQQQVRNNTESLRRQYELVDHARELGFKHVVVIDDDLGRTASGRADRPGFQRLFKEVVGGEVGAVFCLEISRLARNGQDWHALIEACAYVDTLVISPNGAADPGDVNDRLLLGVKGVLSEHELSLFRQRGYEAKRAKAARGELRIRTPIGYIWTEDDRMVPDPNRRVREAIKLVFDKFSELGSARQTVRWFVQEELQLPSRRSLHADVVWRVPTYHPVLTMLKNPVYAGAYVSGRTKYRMEMVSGRQRKTAVGKLPLEEAEVLIRDHHPAYITWAVFEQNQQVLADNNYRTSATSPHSARGGRALVSGLLRCARCGRTMRVGYSGHQGMVVRYWCPKDEHRARCISFGGRAVDTRVAETLQSALSPYAIEAALRAAELVSERRDQKRQALNNELEQAKYQTELARRRYQAVDPANRLVADQLEADWEQSLERVASVMERLETLGAENATAPSIDTERLFTLGQDLEEVWGRSELDMERRQRIVRILVKEILVDVDEETNEVVVTIHWRGGRHSTFRAAKRRTGQHHRCTPQSVVELLKKMDGRWTDDDAARLLNRLNLKTGTGKPWTRVRVRSTRASHQIPAYDPTSANRLMTLAECARVLGISGTAVRRMINNGILPARQICPGARWEIERDDLERSEVSTHAAEVAAGRRPRFSANNCAQLTLSDLEMGGVSHPQNEIPQ